jgi:glycosyltransferase involved in cell wall biosynthesis
MATPMQELIGSPHPSISVILPVLNEQSHLESSVRSILSQDYRGPIEVILAIGPSKDKTLEIAERLASADSRVVLVENPTGKTAAGLNLALKQTMNPVVVRVDAHAEIPKNYLSLIVEVLNKTGAVNVGGVMAAVGKTTFEKSVAGAMRSAFGVGASRFHTGGEAGPVDTVYLGAFRREALIAIGGFDERFTRAQDWELNFRLRENGGIIYFDPRLHVTYRPRSTVRALAKQYFEYGRWRRVVSRRHKGTINYRYLAPPVALLGFLASLVLGLLLSPILFIPAAIYTLFVLGASIKISSSLQEFFLLLLVLPTMHFAWGAGFISSPKTLVPSTE